MSAILDVIQENGETETYDTDWVTDQLKKKGFWSDRSARTPRRTVNSYFSQSPDLFEHMGQNRYRLRVDRLSPRPIIHSIDDVEETEPNRTQQSVARIIRQTLLIQKLKRLHDDRCQICGLAVQIADQTYSEGHHIRPLAKKGPDITENILILCPNHHVQCDLGGIRLDRMNLRLDSRHPIADQFIDWHNQYFLPSETE